MKKLTIKSYYKLKVINDGSSLYNWIHPWKGWLPLTNKDITSNYLWKASTTNTSTNLTSKTSYIKDYTKKFTKY